MRAALVGCGSIGRIHALAISEAKPAWLCGHPAGTGPAYAIMKMGKQAEINISLRSVFQPVFFRRQPIFLFKQAIKITAVIIADGRHNRFQ